jgi:hypothetical protein
MRFDMHPRDALTTALFGGNAWEIYASGTIDDDAAARFLKMVAEKHVPAYSTVYIDSPGGNLIAAMKLGRAIRSSGFDTSVATRADKNKTHLGPGVCLSACTLTFLGGKWRYIDSRSVYGVHRFYFEQSTRQDSDVAQMISAVVVQYIRDMGADPQLFSEMTSSGKEEITLIPESELLRLNVVNNGQTPTEWSVQSAKGSVYLKGERDTVYGFNKFILGCSREGAVLMVFFDPQGNERKVLSMENISLLVDDDKELPLESTLKGKQLTSGGLIEAEFLIPTSYLAAIMQAHKVGVAFQHERGMFTMLGFQGMDFDGARDKLNGVLRGCLPN